MYLAGSGLSPHTHVSATELDQPSGCGDWVDTEGPRPGTSLDKIKYPDSKSTNTVSPMFVNV
jgi:hypothetical protein